MDVSGWENLERKFETLTRTLSIKLKNLVLVLDARGIHGENF